MNSPITILTLFLFFKQVFSVKNNVLFIVVDDLRPALGCYGDKTAYTPNIDALAAKSFVFTNAFAQQALCAPSRNSFLTSRRPDSLHLYDFYSYWRDSIGNYTTIPQHFKENGYYTHSIGKVFHPGISSNFSDDSPYSWSGKPFHPKTQAFKDAKTCIDHDGQLEDNLICPVIVESQPEGTLPDLESLNAAFDFLNYKNNITDKPYFLAVGFHKPHVPFKFPLQYLNHHPIENIQLPVNRWRPSLLPTVAWNPWSDIRTRHDINVLNISFPFGPMPDDTIRKIIQSYYSATSYIDDLVGQLLRKVDKNTIIILTGDHGWSLGEHGEFAKFSNFEIATRVPLLIHVPQLSNKEIIVNNLVELVDLFPTLVDLTQVSHSLNICPEKENKVLCTEGRSLVGIMSSKINKTIKSNEKSAVFTQYPRPGAFPTQKPNSDHPRLKDIKIMGYSIKTEKFRYAQWVHFNSNNFTVDWDVIYGRELYDHLLDPNENMNLINIPQLTNLTNILSYKLKLGWRFA